MESGVYIIITLCISYTKIICISNNLVVNNKLQKTPRPQFAHRKTHVQAKEASKLVDNMGMAHTESFVSRALYDKVPTHDAKGEASV